MSSLLSPGCPPGRAGGGAGAAGGWALRTRRPRWPCTRHVHTTSYKARHRAHVWCRAAEAHRGAGWAEHKAEQEAQLSPTSAAAAPRTSRSNPEPFNAQRPPPHLPLFTIPLYLHFYFLDIPGGHKTNTFTILTSPISDP